MNGDLPRSVGEVFFSLIRVPQPNGGAETVASPGQSGHFVDLGPPIRACIHLRRA